MNPLSPDQKEELRHAVLQALVIRAPAALTVRQVTRAAKKDLAFLFEESDAEGACELLRGLDPALVDFRVDGLGSTKYWRATSAGVLHVERC